MRFKNPWVSATKRLLTKEAEHALYEKAANDIELNNIHKGIWTKAFSLSEGNEQKQKAKYIELMVEYYKDLILAGEEVEDIIASEEEVIQKREAEAEADREEIAKRKKDEIERQERVKAVEEEKSLEAAQVWEKQKKDREEQKKWLDSPEGQKEIRKKKRKYLIGIISIIFIVLLFFLDKKFPKNMTYECGYGDNKEIVYVDGKDELVVKNITTGKNAYSFPDGKNDEYIVYVLWGTLSNEGFMLKRDTKELGQMNPNQLCKFLGSKRYFK